jgi:branched-chain amino acid transport system ATP-binding protein
VLVEQHVHQALALADRAYVMRRGSIAAAGTGREVASRYDSLRDSYL